jgi:hypothetical protein
MTKTRRRKTGVLENIRSEFIEVMATIHITTLD